MELPLAADRAGPAPLTAQIVGQLRAAMADGRLAAGERLPSTRALAGTLGVSRTVVTGAYAQLFAEGWMEGRHGSGTYVAARCAGPPTARPGAAAPPGPGWAPAWPGGRGRAWAAGWPPAAPAPGRAAAGHPLDGRHRPGGLAAGLARRRPEAPTAGPTRRAPPRCAMPLTGYLRRSRAVRCGPSRSWSPGASRRA